jgi:hypothetical protein
MEPDSTPAPFLFGRGVARGAADPRGGCRGARHYYDRMGDRL